MTSANADLFAAGDQLFDLTHQLINIASVSRGESEVQRFIEGLIPQAFQQIYNNDTVVVWVRDNTRPIDVLLAGHTDTVPIANNVPATVTDDVIVGRGAADMKGGLAVQIQLARSVASGALETQANVGLLIFGREELSANDSALVPALSQCTELHRTGIAILLEPTANVVELGCQGNLNIDVDFHGVAAHTARPWVGHNAVHQAVISSQEVAGAKPQESVVDGLVYKEVASITKLTGGNARNVIPDSAHLELNVRYSPARTADEAAEFWLGQFRDANCTVRVVGNAAGSLPFANNPAIRQLIAASQSAPQPKQAWTNVADFTEIGVAAANFGPGDPKFAHKDDEQIRRVDLTNNFNVLAKFLADFVPS